MHTPTLHITPVDDLIEHTTTEDCPCGPQDRPVPNEDGTIHWLVVHHSLDGREHTEQPAPKPPEGGG